MPPLSAGPHDIPGAEMPTWIVRFDKDGLCVSPATAAALVAHLGASDPTDVLFYSHGWNTDFGAAVDHYGRFIQAFERLLAAHPVPGFRPIFVGLTWPSAWLPEEAGPTMRSDGRDALVAEIGALLPPADRARLYALADAATLDAAEALALAELLAPLMGDADDAGMDEVADDAAPGDAGLQPADLVEGATRLARAEGTPAAPAGPIPSPDDLPDIAAGVAGIADAINPRGILRMFSLLQMKDRAGRVGANGVAQLLGQMLAATSARMHVMGHSFGTKVMLSAICTPPALPRPVDSLLLLQPAISHLAMADRVPGRAGPGGYRAVFGRVRGPIFATFSKMDMPLHDVFHLALRRRADLGEMRTAAAGAPPSKFAALGGYGPRSSGERILDPIPAPGVDYGDLGGARLVGLDGSDRRITSHSDVANGYTAWALRQLIVSGRG